MANIKAKNLKPGDVVVVDYGDGPQLITIGTTITPHVEISTSEGLIMCESDEIFEVIRRNKR